MISDFSGQWHLMIPPLRFFDQLQLHCRLTNVIVKHRKVSYCNRFLFFFGGYKLCLHPFLQIPLLSLPICTLPHTSKLATLTNTFSLAWLPSILRDAVASWGSPVIVAVRISGLPQRRSLRRQKTRRNPGFTGNIGMSLGVKPASIFSYHDGLGKWSNLTIFCFKWVESTNANYYILDYIGCQF